MEIGPGLEELRVRYLEILGRDVGIPEYKKPYYWKWLYDFLGFCRVRHLADTDRNGMELFLETLRKRGRMGFQVDQARVAVEVFWMHFHRDGMGVDGQRIRDVGKKDLPGDWRMAMAALSKEVELRRYSPKTLKVYRHWTRDFSRFVSEAPVASLTEERAKDFISHLASDRKVAEATQNQAFSAVLFFYNHVLRIGLEGMQSVPRASKRQEVPTVLTRGEVQSVLGALEYPYRLFVQLLYGCGLRLGEGLMIRVQDLDLNGGALRVFYGKGRKSRSVPLPKTLVSPLSKHLESVRALFESDMKVGFAGVFLPGTLDLKLPGAARSWPWQWVFPAGRLTFTKTDGSSGASISTSRAFKRKSRPRRMHRVCQSAFLPIPSGTVMRPICCKWDTTYGRSRNCLGITTWKRP